MLSLKPGVSLRQLEPQMVLAVIVCRWVFADHGEACVITSGSDGTHSRNSKHYIGQALDLRTNDVPAVKKPLIVKRITEALGAEFFVLFEGEGTANEHLHVQWNGYAR